MGGYMTKVGDEDNPGSSAGLELARSDLKAGRGGASRSPFGILEDHARRGESADWRLFSEWLVVSKGRRTLEWSRGLRALLIPEVETLTDEEIAAEHEPAVNIASISPDVWREMVIRRLSVAAIGAVEARGLGGLLVLVRAAGMPVEIERQDLGPPQLVLFDPRWGWSWAGD
jgi:hypothetical protein